MTARSCGGACSPAVRFRISAASLHRLPRTGALGSLVAYATNPEVVDYQPMHVNFGLVPPLEGKRMRKQQRYAAYCQRAREDLAAYVATRPDLFAAAGE